ncbi:hypothetical protein CAL7716_095060 [Calothrix sp. PCC 7716]|nr:hypothetical protein CAL7716_095060 [Calothrix sp. PCC 7716]
MYGGHCPPYFEPGLSCVRLISDIHDAREMNLEIIWETIQRDLPPLLEQLQELQSRLNS